MEEKKLTDEEIVRALDLCANGLCDLSCPAHNLQNTITCQDYMNKLVLDLIHRLQSENKELKSPKFASWKLKFFNLKEEFDKELSEHEEFTKKAKAEIERLTEERDMYADDLYWKAEVRKREDFITELTVENAELQKQVDELKKWLDMKEHYIAISKDNEKQVAKDTAKEILDEVSKHFGGKWLVELYKKYGLEWSVEVE